MEHTMGRKELTGLTITYAEIAKLTDSTLNAVHQAAAKSRASCPTRQMLNIGDLESVVLWVAGHGKVELRQRIAAAAAPAWSDTPEYSRTAKRVRKAKKPVDD